MSHGRGRYIPLAVLVTAYTAIYLCAVFAFVRDAEFMSADPHSIINAINALFEEPVYDMNGHYHSIVYGWTYYAMNFVALLPIKALGITDPLVANVTVRALLFAVGLGLLLIFYTIARRLLGVPLALAASLVFATNHMAARAFIEIHPESTGVLLYLTGFFFLAKVVENSTFKQKNYVIAIVFLSLASLAKQPFAVIAFFSWISFAILFANSTNIPLLTFARSKIARDFLIQAIFIFIAIAVVIHPYAFVEFDKFFAGQLRPLGHASGNTFGDAAQRWWAALTEEPIGVVNFSLLLLLPLARILGFSKLFICSLISTCCISLIFIYMQKLVPRATYLFPLYPLYYLNIFYALKRLHIVGRRYSKPTCSIVTGAVILIAVPMLILNVSQAIYLAHSRIFMSGYADKNLTWDFLETVPASRRIAFSSDVAVPPQFDKRCHPWRYCRSLDGMNLYEPEIVFVRRKNGTLRPAVFADYIKANGFRKDRTLSVEHPQKLWCGLLGRSISYRKSPNRPSTERSKAFFRELSMLSNLDFRKTFTRISRCANHYVGNLNARLKGKIVGRDIEIWMKPTKEN